MLGYNVFLFLLYVMIPVLVRKSSATLVNLSFLTSDVYSVLFGIFLFHAHVRQLLKEGSFAQHTAVTSTMTCLVTACDIMIACGDE
jgi:hypothetical protein